mmetsp:Transcript_11616/g.34167  ORF Transcript_11616/g.34167 Transcript_11616/m.34167 type:complete len:81 (+) Transcript_11616:197-439(+)
MAPALLRGNDRATVRIRRTLSQRELLLQQQVSLSHEDDPDRGIGYYQLDATTLVRTRSHEGQNQSPTGTAFIGGSKQKRW